MINLALGNPISLMMFSSKKTSPATTLTTCNGRPGVYLTKKDVEQVSNEILNAQQYSQLIESWGKKLFYITK